MTLRVDPASLVAAAEASGNPGLVGRAPWWDRVRLIDVARVINGGPFESSRFNVDGIGLPLIRIRDVGKSRPSTWYDGPWEKLHLIRHGDLLVGMDGDFRAARWRGDDGLLNQRVCRIDVDEQGYHHMFLELVLQGYLDLIWQATSSTTVKHLSSKSVGEIPLPRPSLAEQRRIVDILKDHLSRLGAADSYLEAGFRRLIALRWSSLDRYFGSSERSVPLSALVDGVQAGRSFGGASAPASPDEWGIIKVSAMTWGEFRAGENKAVAAAGIDPRYEIKQGDLLVSRANTSGYVGASVLVGPVRSKLLLSDKSLRLIPRPGLKAEWLWRALQAPSARRQISAMATGTKDSMRNISQSALLRVALPDARADEQEDAVVRFRAVDGSIRRLQEQLRAAQRQREGLRRALLAAAFSGQLTGQVGDDDVMEEVADAQTSVRAAE